MKCNQIQEIILTDYLDQCVDEKMEKIVKDHLEHCNACQEFLAVASKVSVEPFAKSKRAELSEQNIWNRIQEQIDNEKDTVREDSYLSLLWKDFKQVFAFPRPAFIFGTMMTLLLVFMIWGQGDYINKKKTIAVNETEEIEYVAYLLGTDEYDIAYDDESTQTELNAYYL